MKPIVDLRRKLASASVALLLGTASALPLTAGAEPLAPGTALPALLLEDQNGKPVQIDAETRIVIFSAGMAASDLVKEVLRGEPAGTLERLHAVYLSDISAMPALITRMIALPKLRELPFPIGLGREAAQLADLPRQTDAATVLHLQDGKLTAVDYAKDAAQLRQAIGLQ
ncbi:hypothetical protein [Rhodocyclus tenuis]|uniref:FAD/FMN-containing dehydrogenase n=1 Tax=Rhodocyclus tenuis TaxID=1066 RepID=A0A840G027_RHOTE|nr:hypothetical protein [Rhodocyclus tenuis]MBB4247504.1 hypothetical protein [Rhodocyclus tenuis]MBK1679586.1 hypothetical protein [Rhodocyclus tenuis]